MSWDRFIGKKKEDNEVVEEKKSEQKVEKVVKNNQGEVSTLVPFKMNGKYYISKVHFNPDEHETYEMHQERLAATFLKDQDHSLNIFFKQYQEAKKKG